MIFRRQANRCENIAEWLATATDELCAQARARVTPEIEAHYKEAVAFHQTEGKSLIDAQRIALDELGDPKAAARRFRKKHLTQNQLEKLNEWEQAVQKQPSKLGTFIFSLSLLAIVVLGWNSQSDNNWLFFGTMWLLLGPMPWVRYLLQRLYPTKLTIQSLVVVTQFFGPACAMAIIVLIDYLTRKPSYLAPELHRIFGLLAPCVLGLGWLVAFVRAFYWLRVWRKLHNEPLPEQ